MNEQVGLTDNGKTEGVILFDLSNKNITKFPIFDLNNLQYLYLDTNRLKELPLDLFSDAPNLKWLDVRNNILETIPLTIKNHEKIETILLQNNRISYLPTVIATVKSLKILGLAGNPITYPKKRIINSGLETLLAFLRLEYQKETDDIIDLNNYKDSNESLAENDDECDDQGHQEFKEEYKTDFSNGKKKKKNKHRVSHEETFDSFQSTVDSKIPIKNSDRYLTKKMTPPTKNEQDIRIRENIMREIWLDKRKELLMRREKVLQDSKSLNALKNWRKDYKMAQSNCSNTYYTLNLSNLPYDTDLNYVKILTRADIEKDLPEKYKKKLIRGNRKTAPIAEERLNIQAKIDEIIDSMSSIQRVSGDWTPRTERKMITCEIKKLSELQKKISKLKGEN